MRGAYSSVQGLVRGLIRFVHANEDWTITKATPNEVINGHSETVR